VVRDGGPIGLTLTGGDAAYPILQEFVDQISNLKEETPF